MTNSGDMSGIDSPLPIVSQPARQLARFGVGPLIPVIRVFPLNQSAPEGEI
jgi:hypothetical protein